MSASRLLDHFDRIKGTPDTMQKLRGFILDLAVRGKLVEQDSADEPAIELIARIRTLKAQLLSQRAAVRENAMPALTDGSLPYRLPAQWSWTQLGVVGLLSPRNSASDAASASFVPMALISSDYGVAHGHEVRTWGEIKGGYTHFADGDVGLAKITPCFENGKSTVFRDLVDGIGAGTTELHVVRPIVVSPEYVLIYLKSPQFIQSGIQLMTGTAGQKRVPTEYFAWSAFPLPPLAEQHRIVAKVKELMDLCDQLSKAEVERESRRDRLVGASLLRVSRAADDDPVALRKHARFHLDNLPRLATRAEHVRALRQTVLNLAIRGKLVPQDPSDEPADELLERIGAEKASLGAKQRVRRVGTVTSPEPEHRFAIPSSWTWAVLGDIVISRDGERIPVSKDERTRRGKVYDYYGASGVIDKIDDYLFDKPLLLVGEDGANLVNRSTPIAFIARGRYWVNNHAHVLDGISETLLLFLEIYFNAIDLKPYVTGTAQPKMNQAKMNSIPIAVPPEAEQSRIVQRAQQLLTMCTTLELQAEHVREHRERLLSALLKEALSSAA